MTGAREVEVMVAEVGCWYGHHWRIPRRRATDTGTRLCGGSSAGALGELPSAVSTVSAAPAAAAAAAAGTVVAPSTTVTLHAYWVAAATCTD